MISLLPCTRQSAILLSREREKDFNQCLILIHQEEKKRNLNQNGLMRMASLLRQKRSGFLRICFLSWRRLHENYMRRITQSSYKQSKKSKNRRLKILKSFSDCNSQKDLEPRKTRFNNMIKLYIIPSNSAIVSYGRFV